MNSTTTYSVGDARSAFAEILNRVAYSGEVVTIVKHGEPMVRVIPARSSVSSEAFAKYFGIWRDKPWAKTVGKASRRFRKNRFAV